MARLKIQGRRKMVDQEHDNVSNEQVRVRMRLAHILGWHTRVEDMKLSDTKFILAVLGRYQQHRHSKLIDPNE